jgi:E3 ubiquitin-protein ligase CCNP1IP1
MFQDAYEDKENDTTATPSSHRHRVSVPSARPVSIGLDSHQTPRQQRLPGTPTLLNRLTPSHQPLRNLNMTAIHGNGFAGYGMSAGVKASNPPNLDHNFVGITQPAVRSRGMYREQF